MFCEFRVIMPINFKFKSNLIFFPYALAPVLILALALARIVLFVPVPVCVPVPEFQKLRPNSN